MISFQSKGNWVWGEPLDPQLYFFSKDFRHAGLMIKDNKYLIAKQNFHFIMTKADQVLPFLQKFLKLLVFWSKVGDNPERILMTEV